MWDRPEELIGRSDVDKHIQEPPHKRGLEDGKKTGVDNRFHTLLKTVNAAVGLWVTVPVCKQVSIRRSQN